MLQSAAQKGMKGVLISISKVDVTVDLSDAKVFVSVFPSNQRDDLIAGIQSNAFTIRHELAQRTKHQLRKVPRLTFQGDDSLDYVEKIDASLRGEDPNPIKNPEVLPKRKKS